MIAEIIINSNVKNLNKTFDYIIPKNLENYIFVGSRVFVQFGNKKQPEEGFVVKIKETSEYIDKLKEIIEVEDLSNVSKEKLELAKYMARRYFCNISECIKQMLPPGTTSSNITKRVNEKKQNFVSLIKDPEEIEEDIINHVLKSEKQIRALKFLIENDEVSSVDFQNFSDVSLAILKTLEKNGYIEIYEKEVERNPFIHKVVNKTTNLALNEEQQEAFEKINASIQFNEYDEFLLFGVTGSRKNRSIYSTYRRDFKAWKIKYSIGSRNITNASNCG